MLADTSLRFTKCRMPVADTQFQNLIKVTKVRKKNNYEHYWRFKSSLVSPATSAHMWFNSWLRHNAFRKPGLRTFPLRSHSIVVSQWIGIQHPQCMQLCMLLVQR